MPKPPLLRPAVVRTAGYALVVAGSALLLAGVVPLGAAAAVAMVGLGLAALWRADA